MLSTNHASSFWTAVAQCREAFWAGHSEAAQHHITTAAHLAGLPLDPDSSRDKKQKIDLLEQLAELYKLDLKLAPVAVSKDDKVFDHISPGGLPGVSIVTCSKNRTENLIKALQTWLPHDQVKEIVIVDWCSDRPVRADLDEAQIHDFRIRIIRAENEPFWILSPAFNLGFRFARHETILKADADITLSADFFNKNPLPRDSFIAGNWRHAREGQAFINGFFYTTKAALAQVGGFNEYITTYGWDDDDLYDRLVLEGQTRVDVATDTVNHLDHSDDDRLTQQEFVKIDKKPDTISLSARQQLCANTMFLIRRNRMIAAIMPPWRAKSTLLPFNVLAYENADVHVRRGNWNPSHVPDYISADADFYALSELLSWRLSPRVRALDRHRLGQLLKKPLSEIARLDVEIALSNRPDAVCEDRFCVLSVASHVIDAEGMQLPILLQRLADRMRTKGYCPVLRLNMARLPEKNRAQLLDSYPCLDPRQDLGKLQKTDLDGLGAAGLPRKVAIHVEREMAIDILKSRPTADRPPGAAQVTPQVVVPRARLFIDAQHGLGNRMRAIGSAAAIAEATGRELVIVWQPDHHCEGRFWDLFDYDGAVIEDTFVAQAADRGCKVYNYMEIEAGAEKNAPLDLTWTGDVYARAAYVLNAAPSTWSAENRFLRGLTPVGAVRDLVAGVRTPNDLSAHVRMVGGAEYEHLAYEALDNWTEDGHAQTDFWRKKSHFSHFIKRIDALISEGRAERLFVAADKPETYEAFMQTFGERVAYLPRALYDRSSEQLQYALADALLLGTAPLLLGSSWSSFSELAARLSPQKMTIEMSGKDF